MLAPSRFSIPAALLALALLGATAPAASAAGGVSVEGPLAEFGSKAALNTELGHEPVQCQPLPQPGVATAEICEWRLGNRDAAWKRLAALLGTDDRVGVICVLDLATGARKVGSCTGSALRSNRDQFRNRGGYRKDKTRQRLDKERREERRREAVAALDAAPQLEAIARQLGEVAQTCNSVSGDVVCTWHTNARTPGHGTVVATIDGDMMKQARLTCRLPADGSARQPGSCQAEIGR